MDDDDKAEIARQGLDLIESADPEAIRDQLSEAAKRAAKDVLLGGIDTLSGLAGTKRRRTRTGPSAEAVERALVAMDAHAVAAFDERLAEAAARATEEADERVNDLATLRRSFPAASRELALLLFACADMLEDLADEDRPPSSEELARKEALIERIGALLAPRAEVALTSFVAHVIELSRRHRASP